VLAGISSGIMQACLEWSFRTCASATVRYADRELPADPGQGADKYVALNSARAYVYQVARNCDAGKTTRFDAAGAILLASESAVKVSLEAIQALGGAGYTKDWPVERFMRDAKLLDIGAGTNEIRRMLIGRELIGA
jgi:isovaleryl-CoA dehydrogenase